MELVRDEGFTSCVADDVLTTIKTKALQLHALDTDRTVHNPIGAEVEVTLVGL